MSKDRSVTKSATAGHKLLGTYPQKQEGLFMQRIPVFGGQIGWPQWRRIAEIARRYTPGTGLHVTTRQNIELHNVRREDVSSVLEELSRAGISLFGAGGDSLRNITVNPAWECDPNGIDVVPLALMVRDHLMLNAPLLSLGRKFKISFSGSWTHHSQPYLNDLGFTALRPNLFEAVGAGSLGARPEPGILLHAGLTSEEVVWLCQAAVGLFAELGDRENRRTARLRHIRTRLGDEEFKRQLDLRFQAARTRYAPAAVILPQARPRIKRQHVLMLPSGNLSAEAALALADAAEKNGAALRINLNHGLELYGLRAVELPAELASLQDRPVVIACPGSDSCPKALVHTRALAERIFDADPPSLRNRVVAVSGCPNDCARSRMADIGLAGRQRTVDGRRQECFEVFAGGENGGSRQLGQSVGIAAAEELSADPGIIDRMTKAGANS